MLITDRAKPLKNGEHGLSSCFLQLAFTIPVITRRPSLVQTGLLEALHDRRISC
jgi:hypothetical protein